MSIAKKIGKVLETKEKDFEWVIENFLSYSEAELVYVSPDFELADALWHFEINPNGRPGRNSVGHVGLFVHQNERKTSQRKVELLVGMKTAENTLVNERRTIWNTDDIGWGWVKYIERNKLQEDKENLIPSDTLTVVWKLKIEPDFSARQKELAADHKKMFFSKKFCDLTLKVKGETFLAHKYVLAVRSPVFATMLQNDMLEKTTGVIEISDCDPESFDAFLLFLYCGEADFSICNVFRLYEIADKYDVIGLKLMCADYMIHKISAEKVCETFILGHQFCDSEIITCTQNFFNENFNKIIYTKKWQTLMEEDSELANSLLKGLAAKIKVER